MDIDTINRILDVAGWIQEFDSEVANRMEG
jgi:hypothetical protein